MIEIIEITFICTVIAIAYQILIMPGELLQGWARFVNTFSFRIREISYDEAVKNSGYNTYVMFFRKLLLCPYCFGGQLALWTSLGLIYKGYGSYVLLSVPCVIVAVYFIVKSNFK